MSVAVAEVTRAAYAAEVSRRTRKDESF